MAYRRRSGSASDEDGAYRPTTLYHRQSLHGAGGPPPSPQRKRFSSAASAHHSTMLPYDHDDDREVDAATTIGQTELMGGTKLQRKSQYERDQMNLLEARIQALRPGERSAAAAAVATYVDINSSGHRHRQREAATGTFHKQKGVVSARSGGNLREQQATQRSTHLTRAASSSAAMMNRSARSKSAHTLPRILSGRTGGALKPAAISPHLPPPHQSVEVSTARSSSYPTKGTGRRGVSDNTTSPYVMPGRGRSNTKRSAYAGTGSRSSSRSSYSNSPSPSDSPLSSTESSGLRGGSSGIRKRRGNKSLLGGRKGGGNASVLERATAILERLESDESSTGGSGSDDAEEEEERAATMTARSNYRSQQPPRQSSIGSPPSFRGLKTITTATTPTGTGRTFFSAGSNLSLRRQKQLQSRHLSHGRLETHDEDHTIITASHTQHTDTLTATRERRASLPRSRRASVQSHSHGAGIGTSVLGSEVGTQLLGHAAGLEDLDEEEREIVDEALEDFAFVRKTIPRAFLSHEEDRTELRCLDYSPLCNARPVDLTETLRVVKAGRKIRLSIGITCYNEPGDELRRTLVGIAENLPKLNRVAGLHWSEIMVTITMDGIDYMSTQMRDFLTHDLKIFDPSLLRQSHAGRPVVMHLFERTVEMARHSSQREYYHPLQLALAVKARNGGKLNSHLWFFSGFSVQVNPKYTMLMDCGTVPRKDSMVKIYQHLEQNPQVGGTCGEIAVRDPRPFNLLDGAQTFEYLLSSVLDKPAESFAGCISVLPGAWSCYRWVAIRGEPLCSYFLLEEQAISDLGPSISNMYLAEDRILCFEICAKANRNWLLSFVTDAAADTDAPTTLVDLIKQRRRWMNGAFFAQVYALLGFGRLLKTAHSLPQKLIFLTQFVFNILAAIL
jgi:cellulose synthase/poly-beta-1,6-N-acetylglucosamine synthase-like glycosyltransferase